MAEICGPRRAVRGMLQTGLKDSGAVANGNSQTGAPVRQACGQHRGTIGRYQEDANRFAGWLAKGTWRRIRAR